MGKGGEEDNETDTYIPPPPNIPFTVNHLYATLNATGPLITEFPIPVQALMDSGSPCTVISAEFCDRLGLRRYPLPKRENNLTSLSQAPLKCEEYVKLELVSGQGEWKSRVHKIKVNKGLPFPIILGMPWLALEQIVMDPHTGSAIDKHSGYNILNPPAFITKTRATPQVPLPPTPKKIRVPKLPTLEETGAPALAGYLLPGPVMAAVRERLEGLAFQEVLKSEDAKMKRKYADRFPTRLPDTTDHVPGHMFHRIRLKDPTKVNNGKGYAAPKKYQESWKKLLDDHLKASRIRPSSSEYASPAFCIPKYQAGIPDLTVPPRWVNDYRALNGNTVRDSFPLPHVDDILADCGKGKLFAKMDMTNSFFQTRVHPDDIHLTAVRTPWGLYEWTVMPQGGCNAPATHQRRMTDALREHIGKICHLYLDDIIIW